MAPHHHLRSAFVTNPALFSFPASTAVVPSQCATPLVQHVQATSLDAPHKRTRTRMTALSPIASGIEKQPSSSSGSAMFGGGEVREPFWKGFMTGKIESRARERGGVATSSCQVEQVEGKQAIRPVSTNERKRALVFAGLVRPSAGLYSFPHTRVLTHDHRARIHTNRRPRLPPPSAYGNEHPRHSSLRVPR